MKKWTLILILAALLSFFLCGLSANTLILMRMLSNLLDRARRDEFDLKSEWYSYKGTECPMVYLSTVQNVARTMGSLPYVQLTKLLKVFFAWDRMETVVDMYGSRMHRRYIYCWKCISTSTPTCLVGMYLRQMVHLEHTNVLQQPRMQKSERSGKWSRISFTTSATPRFFRYKWQV